MPSQVKLPRRAPSVALLRRARRGLRLAARERSRPLAHVIDDVKKLVDRGVKEVTVLGQNVNSYESDCGANFAKLLQTLAVDTGIQRIRYTTSHPKD